MYEIEKDIPFPGKQSQAHQMPFEEMEPGDSILIEANLRNSAMKLANQIGDQLNRTFISRTVEKDANGKPTKVRIWRTE